VRVAVVGAGIAGLAAAWDLRNRASVTVFDPGPLGGKLQTPPFDGRPVDSGPDAFLTRVPDAVQLCRALDLEGELVPPAAGRALLWWRGRLRALPDGLVLGAPRRVGPLVGSGLLSPLGMARAGLDLVLPRRPLPDDLPVFDLVASRFGRQVAARLVDPLIGGIHAGRTEELSVAAVAPQLLGAARAHRSLMLALRRGGEPPAGPVFLAPSGGFAQLVDRLVGRLGDSGVEFAPVAARTLRPVELGRVAVHADWRPFDAVVLAVAGPVASTLLDGACPELAAIESSSVVVVTMSYPSDAVATPPGSSGFLVPRSEERLITACSFASAKWPHWGVAGQTLLRVSAGRSGDDRALRMSDDVLVERLGAELRLALGTRAEPALVRVSRWPSAFPQYRVGHLDRVARIEDRVSSAWPQVALAGASYHGSGIPACIRSGSRAATAVVAHLARR
jgi:oxygen-dependent protoporphyrinogen oxidase